MARKYPLEIILRHTGQAELVDSNDSVIWSSDADDDFKETISQEFLTEEDVDDVLEYLSDKEILNETECARFENGSWDVTEESLDGESDVPPPVADEDDDDDDEYEDDSDDE